MLISLVGRPLPLSGTNHRVPHKNPRKHGASDALFANPGGVTVSNSIALRPPGGELQHQQLRSLELKLEARGPQQVRPRLEPRAHRDRPTHPSPHACTYADARRRTHTLRGQACPRSCPQCCAGVRCARWPPELPARLPHTSFAVPVAANRPAPAAAAGTRPCTGESLKEILTKEIDQTPV